MERHLELLVAADGTLAWAEGTLVIPDSLRGAFAGLMPGASFELVGDYQRVDAKTRVLKVKRAPKLIATPAEKAVRALHRPEELARWVAYLTDASPNTQALKGVHAAQSGDFGAAGVLLAQVLARPEPLAPPGVPGAEPRTDLVVELWALLEAQQRMPSLDRRQREQLTDCGWRGVETGQYAALKLLIEDSVADVYAALALEDRVAPPWHFGGARARPGGELAAWLNGQVRRLATPGERAEVDRLLPLPSEELEAYLAHVEAHDEALEAEAYQAVIDAHPVDSEDSPPDSADVDEEALLRRTLGAIVAALELGRREGAARPGSLVRLIAKRLGAQAARRFAVEYDAAALLSGLAPALVGSLTAVVSSRGGTRGGHALCELTGDDAWVLLLAPDGALGAWEVHPGDARAVLGCVPTPDFPGAAEAVRARLASRGRS